MTTLESTGQITIHGQIELDQPTDLPPGTAVHVILKAFDDLSHDGDLELDGQITVEGRISLDEPTDLQPGAAVRVIVNLSDEPPFDDDPEWNSVFLKSLGILQRHADKARQDYDEGKTMPLNPEQL